MAGEPQSRVESTGKRGSVRVEFGKPLAFEPSTDSSTVELRVDSRVRRRIETLQAYYKAAKALIEGKYANLRLSAPTHLRGECDTFFLLCSDGMFVRYDAVSQNNSVPKIRGAIDPRSLAELAPLFSENVVHFPVDPRTWIAPAPFHTISLAKNGPNTPETLIANYSPMICLSTTLPEGFQVSPPPARPVCFLSMQNEFRIQMYGISAPVNKPLKVEDPTLDHFIATGSIKLASGWQALEFYPSLSDDYWKPENAASWAELDLLAITVQRNLQDAQLKALDSRGETRKHYAALLDEFTALLEGPEEPVHQFLKKHPELLSQTHQEYWSKLRFGDTSSDYDVSDFVFRNPFNDYELVEIEAPYRKLFREDGHQRAELTHAIGQIQDWRTYIADNKTKVEELGLVGISSNPRALVVMGRSVGLSDENRKKLSTIQADCPKLRVLTYDDVITSARTNLEHILGPLHSAGPNVELYWFKGPVPSLPVV